MLSAIVASLLPATWTLVLGGDLMLNGVSPKSNLFEGIAPLVRNADLAFANLEVPLATSKTATSRKSRDELRAKSQFILKASPRHAKHLAEAGFDGVSLGNNHAMDYGPRGLGETREALISQGIAWAGAGGSWAEARREAVLTTPSGTRVALVSFLAFVTERAMRKCTPATQQHAGVAVLPLGGVVGERQKKRLSQIVATARRNADVVVVALHWGTERKTVPNGYQVALGRAFADAGADVVWGHHPHTLQGVEVLKGKPVLYSTGNLVSSKAGSTALYELTFEGTRFRSLRAIPCEYSGGAVKPTPEKRLKAAEKALRALDRALAKKHPRR